MHKFLALKNKLISSKRDSQKLDQQQLLKIFTKKSSIGRINQELSAQVRASINRLKQEDYKLQYNHQSSHSFNALTKPSFQVSGHHQGINANNRMKAQQYSSEMPKYRQGHEESAMETSKNNVMFNKNDMVSTVKKQTALPSFGSDSNFTQILQLMTEINKLQRLKFTEERAKQLISKQIKEKLREMKFLISNIEDQSHKSLMDFYNEQANNGNSPDSFNSQNSDETYQQATERQAYELNESDNEGEIQIKYKRISDYNAEEDNELSSFNESVFNFIEHNDEQFDYSSPLKDQKNIIHLFSYEKTKRLDSQLSKISERSSQYESISSKNTEQSISFRGSLQFKKIHYLLETSEKKTKESRYQTEISQFSYSNNEELNGGLNLMKKKNQRSKSHVQLQQMISLLENKYSRKIRNGAQNIMNDLNEALKDNKVHLRSKRTNLNE